MPLRLAPALLLGANAGIESGIQGLAQGQQGTPGIGTSAALGNGVPGRCAAGGEAPDVSSARSPRRVSYAAS